MSDQASRVTPPIAGAGLRDQMHALPLPLAQLVLRALNGKSAADRHHAAFYLAELALKLASAARVGLWLDRALDPASDLARKLEALVQPSLGHWCELLREVTLALSRRADVALLPPLCDAAELARKRPDHRHVAELARRGGEAGVLGEEPTKQALRRGVLGFFDILVAYRNTVIGHGAQRTAAFYDEFGRLLLDAAAEVLADPVLFGGLALVQARPAPDGEAGRTVWYSLTGLAGVLGADDAGDAAPGQLYFHGAGSRVPLHPLIVYRQEDELGREQVGFLNRTARRRPDRGAGAEVVRSVEYLDYASGQTIEGADAPAALTALLARLKGRPVTPSDVEAAATATREGEPKEPSDEPARSGTLIGDFEIEGELGRGSMGIVYKARQRSLGRTVALKVLPPALALDPVARKRFKKEMLALARCDHPNVVRILATGEDGEREYYAMEYVDGTDLAHAGELLSAWRADKGPRGSSRRLAGLFADAALGLSHLHAGGVLHRDLKPGNLMLSADGKRLVIMDLGLAKLADESKALTSADVTILGTLRYMAPEQLQRRLVDVDARADVYGLGATLYEVATGKPVHDGDTEQRLIQQVLQEEPVPPRRAAPSLPVDLATVIQTAIAKLPGQRYTSAAAFAEDLRAVAEERPIRARPPGVFRRAALWGKRRRGVVAALFGVLALGGAGGLFAWDRTRLQVAYYATLTDRRGVHEGVGELPGPEGRSVTRKVLRRGGRVVGVECVNGRGNLAPLSDCGAYSSVDLHYTDDGKVAYTVERGPNGKFLVKYTYAYKDHLLQVARQDRSDLPQPDVGDVAMYRYELDDRGFRRKVTYFNDRGSPRHSFGVYGYEQTGDERGLATALVFLDAEGKPLVRTDGVARATIERDAAGNEVARAFFTVDGKPAVSSSGSTGTRRKLDSRGNVVETAFLGADGQPAAQVDGFAIWRARFDETGCLIERSFFGPDERPVLHRAGHASYRARCDERGREIERAHFGLGGEPVVVKEGYSIVRSRYDERNNEVERAFFGPDGRPRPDVRGAAVVRTTVDERGNPVEVAFFGEGGGPVVTKAGHAAVRWKYDDRDSEVEVAYFGADGGRVVGAEGCAIRRSHVDERGKEIERTCLGVNEAPLVSPEGWATVRTKRDERGKPMELSYLGTNGEPVTHRDGHAALRIGYDDRGNESVRTYLGRGGAPVANAEGYAVWRGQSDVRGRLIEEAYFGADGAPVLLRGGYSVRRMRYDDTGKLLETTLFDLEGKPVAAPRDRQPDALRDRQPDALR